MDEIVIEKINEAKASSPDDYSNGYEICISCGGYYYLGKGFDKRTVTKCPLCKPKKFHYYYTNPFTPDGIGEIGTGENRGLRRAFLTEKQYYVSENGLHLIREQLIKTIEGG